MTHAFVALGSNLDDPRAQVERAFEALARLPDTALLARSRLYRSAPWGGVAQPDFVNAAALVDTGLPARALLDALLAIERRAGRVRGERNGPRVLDLDLLLYGDRALHERAFVLRPLADIAPGLEVPGHGRVLDLLAHADAGDCVPLQ